jgi:hypothetical protein
MIKVKFLKYTFYTPLQYLNGKWLDISEILLHFHFLHIQLFHASYVAIKSFGTFFIK